MVMLWGFSSVITIAAFTASALWWLDGWLPCRIQFTLNAINILRRLVGCHLTRLAKAMQMKSFAAFVDLHLDGMDRLYDVIWEMLLTRADSPSSAVHEG